MTASYKKDTTKEENENKIKQKTYNEKRSEKGKNSIKRRELIKINNNFYSAKSSSHRNLHSALDRKIIYGIWIQKDG